MARATIAPMGLAASDTELVILRTEQLLLEHPPTTTGSSAFLDAQFEAGLAWVHFPLGLGGLGVARHLQSEVIGRLHDAGAPDARAGNSLGYSMGAELLMTYGSDEQKQRYLRPLFLGEERWCQLFSEPGAGSDLAAVTTRAERDGGGWVVNGQKVWSSMANIASIGMLVTRSDWDVPKHHGLTFFLLDMRSPGVQVRPLRQMTGEAEFNEVYLTDVRVPDSARLGDVSDGWRVALATLMNERVTFGRPRIEKGAADEALELYRRWEHPAAELRTRMIDIWIQARVQRLSTVRAAANLAAGTPGPESSTGKLVYTQLNQEAYELCLDLLGDESMLYDSYEMTEFSATSVVEAAQHDVRRRYLRSRATTIEGGTSEVLRNILAERVLGLPPEARPDKDRPFSQLPRS